MEQRDTLLNPDFRAAVSVVSGLLNGAIPGGLNLLSLGF
jgi:hypothetical protein